MTTSSTVDMSAQAQALLQQVQPSLGFQSGDIIMFPIDWPDAMSQPAAVVVAQTTPTSAATNAQFIQNIGVCAIADVSGSIGPVSIDPGASVEDYQRNIEKLPHWQVPPSTVITTVSENPNHGSLSELSGNGRYLYTPTKGYVGPDKATFLVDTGSRQFKLIYFIKVYDAGDGSNQIDCNDPSIWRISLNQDNVDLGVVAFGLPDALSSYQLKNVNVSLNIASLSDGKLR